MLNAWAPVGNPGEVVFAHLFLLLKAEWAVIGGNHLQVILLEAIPQFFLVPFFAERRRKDILGAFKAGLVHIVQGEIKILRTGLGIYRQSAVAGFAHFFKRIIGTKEHDRD